MKKQYQAVTAEEAVKVIKSGDHVHISSVSNVPQCLVKALCDRGRAGELKNVYIHHLHTEGAAPYVNPEFEGIFQHNAFFVGANVRESVQKGLADYIPVFLGETSKLYRERYIKCNVAMIQVCPPDKFGYVSLGSSVDATLAAMERPSAMRWSTSAGSTSLLKTTPPCSPSTCPSPMKWRKPSDAIAPN